jgi:hypothetical protein
MVDAKHSPLTKMLITSAIRNRSTGDGHDVVQLSSANAKRMGQTAFDPIEQALQADWADTHSTTRQWA